MLQKRERKGKKMFYRSNRIAIAVDGPNTHSAVRNLGFDIDFKKMIEFFKVRGTIVRMSYYTSIIENNSVQNNDEDEDEDSNYNPMRPIIDWLSYNGWNVVTKNIREFTDSQGRRKVKGNTNIELAVDALELASNGVQQMIIFTGDGDFVPLVEALKRKGVRVTIVSTIKTRPMMIADALRRAADDFLDLEEMVESISRVRERQEQDEIEED